MAKTALCIASYADALSKIDKLGKRFCAFYSVLAVLHVMNSYRRGVKDNDNPIIFGEVDKL